MSDASDRRVPVELKGLVCSECGVAFGLPVELFERRVALRGYVCCPTGHVQQIGAEPPHEQRLNELERLVAAQGAQLVAALAENTKLRRSIVDRLIGPETAPDPAP